MSNGNFATGLVPPQPFEALSLNGWDGGFQGPFRSESAPGTGVGPWHRGEQLTVSLAPDGTQILGQTSTLFETFGWMLGTEQLEVRILQAFQTWARQTNLNVGLVADGGEAFGTPGLEQHDQRFGDVRVGAIAMAPDVFAVAIPVDDLAAGTWAGEIVFNSQADIRTVRQFYHVALHEAGHVLGLDHSDDPASPMFYGGDSIGLTATDRAEIRALYGERNLDIYERELENNDTFEEATQLKLSGSKAAEEGGLPLVAFGDIKANDVDYFEVNLPSGYQGRLTFRLESIGISALAPTMTMYDESGTLLRRLRSSSQTGAELVVSVPATEEGAKYYLKVEGEADQGVFRVGTYVVGAILVDRVTLGWNRVRELVDRGIYSLEEQEDFQEALLNRQALINRDFGSNDTPSTATLLTTTPGFPDQSRYEIQGSIEAVGERDFYLVRSEKREDGLTHMTVRIDSLVDNGLIPLVEVFTESMQRVRSAVLVNSNGQLSIQAREIQPDQDYLIRVLGDDRNPAYATGDYRMTVDFTPTGATFQKFAEGFVTAEEPIADHSLHVAQSQVLHLNLAAFHQTEEPHALIWLTIYDELGAVYFRSATEPGLTRSANSILFRPGSYAVKVELALPDGSSPVTPFSYLVRGRDISDSEGPRLLDPTDSPFEQCNPPSPEYCYPNDHHSADPYIFVSGGYVQVDPAPTPWVDLNNWYWYDQWLTEEVPSGL